MVSAVDTVGEGHLSGQYLGAREGRAELQEEMESHRIQGKMGLQRFTGSMLNSSRKLLALGKTSPSHKFWPCMIAAGCSGTGVGTPLTSLFIPALYKLVFPKRETVLFTPAPSIIQHMVVP